MADKSYSMPRAARSLPSSRRSTSRSPMSRSCRTSSRRSYLDELNSAVAPATKAGLQVAYGAGAGQIGQQTQDLKSEVIGLACALALLLIMFGSLIAAGIPLVAALFSVLSGLALLALIARVVTFPTTGPTIATLLGLGVAVDYGLFMVARHREQLDTGMEVQRSIRRTAGTSGAAIVVAGSTVAVSVLGLYISGVGFVGSLGLAAAIVVVVTMISALTLVPAFLGLARDDPGADRAGPRQEGWGDGAAAGRPDRQDHA
jgi:RND superfamily putative drug exporter